MADEELPGTKRATELSEQYREAASKIRTRTDTTVKGLGAIGTAAVAGLGYAELADFSPYGGPDWAPPMLLLGVLAMILSLLGMLQRFHKVGESIVTTSDVGETCRLNQFGQPEEGTIASVYRQTATLNGVGSLRAYLARAHRFERLAERAGKDRAAELRQQADLITAEVKATQERASLIILRERARSALFSPLAAALLLFFVAGWYCTATASDAMESRRSEEVDLKKSCVELREKGEGGSLPRVCRELPKKKDEQEKEGKPSAAKAEREGVAAIAKLWSDCRATAEEAKESGPACLRLLRAFEAARPLGP
jgi:hypothetical protein